MLHRVTARRSGHLRTLPQLPIRLQRFGPDLGIDHAGDVAALGDLTEFNQLLAHPGEVVEWQWEIGRHHPGLGGFHEGVFGPRIVRLGIGDLAGQRDGFGPMRDGVTECLDLRRHEADRILAPRAQGLAGHHGAESDRARQRLAGLQQHIETPGTRHRGVFVRHHRGIDHAAEQCIIAVAVAADGGEFHLRVLDAGQRQCGARHRIGRRAGRRSRQRLAGQLLHRGDAGPRHHHIGNRQPRAAHELDVGTARSRRDRAGGGLEALGFARQQRLHADRIVLDLDRLDLETLLLGKSAPRCHQEETRIGLGGDDGLPPELEALRGRSRRGAKPGGCSQQREPRQTSGVGCVHWAILDFGAPGSRCRCDREATLPQFHTLV